MYSSKMIRDSISPDGNRLSTLEVTFPRLILSEFNTHCMLSRNSASSRAVPVHKRIREVLDDPFVPATFGKNQAGMSAAVSLAGDEHELAASIWLEARDKAVDAALRLIFDTTGVSMPVPGCEDYASSTLELLDAETMAKGLDVHKQTANRLLEPFLWHTAIVTATDWNNFFALRANPAAQPEFATIAVQMKETMAESNPDQVAADDWHLPLVMDDELPEVTGDPLRWVRISAARCARVSYLTHDGVRDHAADLGLADRLLLEGHMSPFEHVARAMAGPELEHSRRAGKLLGWTPYRSLIPNEFDFSLMDTSGDV